LGEDRHNLPTREQLQDFFSCIYQNRSINHLGTHSICINDDFGGDLLEGLQGHPSLTSLDFESGNLGSKGCSAIGEVLKHPKCKLTELRLVDNNFDHEGFSALCDALAGNKTLKKLFIGNNEQISTPAGWRALSTVLQSPNCKLIELKLYDTGMNDEGANLLGTALVSLSVSTLDLSSNESISSAGWQTFFSQLSETLVESLDISHNKIDDVGLALLVNIGILKSLNLSGNSSVTPTGWRSFFGLLQTRGTKLKNLSISGTNIGNDGIQALGSLLSNMNTLNELFMGGMSYSPDHSYEISTQGWQSFFTMLQDSNLSLIKFDLSGNNIDDEGIQLLVPLVSRMSSLVQLDLRSSSATPTGWHSLTGYLQSPNFTLKSLDLAENNIDDDVVVAFASVLEHNKTLKFLALYGCTDEDDLYSITERGWAAISTLLCNKTSIMDTYNSNHTLNFVSDDDEVKFVSNDDEESNELTSYLKLNENKDKADVARQKILQTHFSTEDGDSKIQEMLDMELEMLPAFIAWMGRSNSDTNWKGENVSGLSTMFNLMRKVPDLFDSGAHKKNSIAKRKREDQ